MLPAGVLAARYLTEGLDFDAYATPKALGVLAGVSLTGYCVLSGVLHAVAWAAAFLALFACCRPGIRGRTGAVLVPAIVGVLVFGHALSILITTGRAPPFRNRSRCRRCC